MRSQEQIRLLKFLMKYPRGPHTIAPDTRATAKKLAALGLIDYDPDTKQAMAKVTLPEPKTVVIDGSKLAEIDQKTINELLLEMYNGGFLRAKYQLTEVYRVKASQMEYIRNQCEEVFGDVWPREFSRICGWLREVGN